MKTKQAISLAGGTTKALADLLGITSGAISQWGEEVPESRVWQLRVLRPEWFEEPASREGDQATVNAG
jgi:hypothetical protein